MKVFGASQPVLHRIPHIVTLFQGLLISLSQGSAKGDVSEVL